MEKQAFLERFDKKTDKPLEKGFCEIDGKKYYCLTTRAGYWHAFVNCDSFSYFVFLKAIHEMAKFVGEDCVNPEFINVQIKGGYIRGDIIVEDFSKGDRKVVVYSESAKDYKEEDLPGNLLYKFGMSLKEQCQQFKELARYYKNPQIYQGFLKHLLFHHYVGDEDFHFENIEAFVDKNGNSRVSPMFDFSGVHYLSTDEEGFGKWGYNYTQSHLAPESLKYEIIESLKTKYPDEFKNYSIKDIEKEFYIRPEVLEKHVDTIGCLKQQRDLILEVIEELEDKEFIERLLKLDIDKVLTDELFTNELKELFKAGTVYGKQNIERAYNLSKEKGNKNIK